MSWNKYIVVALLLLTLEHVTAQQSKKIKFKVHLKSAELYVKKLKNSTYFIHQDGILIDSIFTKKNTVSLSLSSGHIYKVTFSKKGFTNKHIIVNTIDVPRGKKLKLKADITLFRPQKNWEIDFLEHQPVSIASYNFVKRTLAWDFDYNRSVVEKIILATIKR